MPLLWGRTAKIIEYENLVDEFVDRSGLGPTVSYSEEFEIFLVENNLIFHYFLRQGK